MRGNCYAASEALYHILGGLNGYWKPMVMRLPSGETHWFLKHRGMGMILDPSQKQFKQRPDYGSARGCGFLTKKPSKRAAKLIQELTYQD